MARKKEDTEEKRSVIREWDRWAADHIPTDQKPTGNDGMIFYNYLRKQRPQLLNFKTKGQDPWQIIHQWLLRDRKVVD
jgi:hypothetical protein